MSTRKNRNSNCPWSFWGFGCVSTEETQNTRAGFARTITKSACTSPSVKPSSGALGSTPPASAPDGRRPAKRPVRPCFQPDGGACRAWFCVLGCE